MILPPDNYPTPVRESQYCLAEISDFAGLLPKAYQAGVPVFELTEEEIGETGPVLQGMVTKRDLFLNQFTQLSQFIVDVLRHV